MITINRLRLPVCIAHRGVKETYPENTLISFQKAIEAQAQMIEFDVALSRDRKLVVIHDETLDRTTNGSGRVNGMSLDELRELDAGSWFDPSFNDQRIPTLQDVISLTKSQVVLNIEIKEEYFEEYNPPDAIEKLVLQTILENDILSSVVVSSFEIRFLERLRKLNSELALAFISRHPADGSVFTKCKQLDLFSWNPWIDVLTREQVDQMHEAGIKVFAFTVNDRETIVKGLELGVDGLFADNQPLFERLFAKPNNG